MSSNDVKADDKNILQGTSVEVNKDGKQPESNNQSMSAQNPPMNEGRNLQTVQKPHENDQKDSSPNQNFEGKKLTILFQFF